MDSGKVKYETEKAREMDNQITRSLSSFQLEGLKITMRTRYVTIVHGNPRIKRFGGNTGHEHH